MRLGWLSLMVVLLLDARAAEAVKFISLGEAVKAFLPAGSEPVKLTRTLTADEKARLERDYGWRPTEDQVVFYAGKDAGGQRTAYVLIQPELFGTCFHKYAVGLTPAGVVIDTVIVEMSCPRAMPINKKAFLKQFRAKTHGDPLTTTLDIDAVTGATLSSESAAQATRKAVSLHNLLFGGAQLVTVAQEVRAARAVGAARIQRAVEAGELVEKPESK